MRKNKHTRGFDIYSTFAWWRWNARFDGLLTNKWNRYLSILIVYSDLIFDIWYLIFIFILFLSSIFLLFFALFLRILFIRALLFEYAHWLEAYFFSTIFDSIQLLQNRKMWHIVTDGRAHDSKLWLRILIPFVLWLNASFSIVLISVYFVGAFHFSFVFCFFVIPT